MDVYILLLITCECSTDRRSYIILGESNTYYEEFRQIIMRTILKFLLEGLEKENLRKNYWRAHSYVSADYGMPLLLMRIFAIYF